MGEKEVLENIYAVWLVRGQMVGETPTMAGGETPTMAGGETRPWRGETPTITLIMNSK